MNNHTNKWYLRRILTTKFDLECTLKLTEDLRVGNSFPGLVILDNRRLLVHLLSQVLLG